MTTCSCGSHLGYPVACRQVVAGTAALCSACDDGACKPSSHGSECNNGLTYMDGPPYRCDGECVPEVQS